ncbi:hypothetical protein [Pseudomonas taeanensis]|uniref:hypothetical protein n=1 Tax=Pseudomonas taeanensis TaxID=574962 RepID=UPI0013649C3E|nr:hypothetical protein [Pseudomonas taeanensis]
MPGQLNHEGRQLKPGKAAMVPDGTSTAATSAIPIGAYTIKQIDAQLQGLPSFAKAKLA